MTALKRCRKRYSWSMLRRTLTAALVVAGAQGCHKSAAPAPHAEKPPSAQRDTRGPAPPASGAAAPSAAQPGTAAPGAGALQVHVDNLTAPMPGEAPSRLDVKATKGGLVVDMIDGLACDGSWVWRAHRAGPGRVTVTLSDENHSSVRSSCAGMVHDRVTVSGLPPGSYQVHVAMPTGYGSLDKRVTVKR